MNTLAIIYLVCFAVTLVSGLSHDGPTMKWSDRPGIYWLGGLIGQTAGIALSIYILAS